MVSSQGAKQAYWSPDGRRLLWVALSPAAAMAARVDTSHGFVASVPEKLYDMSTAVGYASLMTNRGQGLLLLPAGQPGGEAIDVLVNWMSTLKK